MSCAHVKNKKKKKKKKKEEEEEEEEEEERKEKEVPRHRNANTIVTMVIRAIHWSCMRNLVVHSDWDEKTIAMLFSSAWVYGIDWCILSQQWDWFVKWQWEEKKKEKW